MALEAGPSRPGEALAFWRAKAPVTPAEYKALSEGARRRAFTVSGLARRDQVELIHTALTRALARGEPLAAFKKRLGPLLEQQGWTGRRAWRVENIYRTNMQTAYMAGRYAQMKAAAPGRPYWRYVAVKDPRTRPTHAALNGRVYRHDHEFWDAWYPPNGFRCRCTVQTMSRRQVEARGIAVEENKPGLVEPVGPDGARLPARPLTPDPGFAGNAGRDWLSGLAPRELEGEVTDLVRLAVCRRGKGLFAGGGTCRPQLSRLDPRHILKFTEADLLPKGLKDAEYVHAFLAEFGLKGVGDSMVHRLPGGIPVPVSKDLFVDRRTGGWKVRKEGRERYMRLLARTILNPYEVWLVPAEVSGRRLTVLRALRLFAGEDGRLGGFAVWNLVGGRRWREATAFAPKLLSAQRMIRYLERQRRGTLVFREP